jgi:hypothetical protein
MKKFGHNSIFVFGIVAILLIFGCWGWYKYRSVCCTLLEPVEDDIVVESFEDCATRYPVMESYPRQCTVPDGQHFVENIGNELEKRALIQIEHPRPNQILTSPLEVRGVARGYWFFEADFPVMLTDWDGLIIAHGIATADGEWMTEDFVPFRAMLEFERPAYGDRGSLILHKDNPSGLPEHDDALEIPVLFPPL